MPVLRGTKARVGRRKNRACDFQRPIKGALPFPLSTGLYERGPQRGDPFHDLLARPLRPVAGAVARDPGLLQPLGLLSEPHRPVQVRGVGFEVLAEDLDRPDLEVRFRDRFGIVPPSGAQTSERFS